MQFIHPSETQMAQETRPALDNLPIEILDLIMDCLDAPSILRLGKVCHMLGQAVLHRLAPPTTLERMHSHSELVIRQDAPVGTISLIVMAPCFPRVTSIVYSAVRDDAHHFLDDMQNLGNLLSHCTPGSLELLKLHITVEHTTESLQRCSESRHRMIESEQQTWAKIISQVLRAAVSIGCTRIEVTNGRLPDRISWHKSPPRSLTNKQNLTVVSRLFRAVRPFSSSLPSNATLPASSGSQRIIFATTLFFMYDFLDHTVEVLHRTSRSIRHLTIESSGYQGLECSYWAWSKLSKSVFLPYLQTLVLKDPHYARLQRGSLFRLLSNNSSIRFLTLDLNLSYDPYSEDKDTPPSATKDTILPNLEILEGRPGTIQWLVPYLAHEKEFSPSTSRPGGPKPISRLKSIRILTDFLPPEYWHESLLDAAILTLNKFFPSNASTGSDTINTTLYPFVKLRVDHRDWRWVKWVHERASPNSLHAKSKIKALVLDINSSVNKLVFNDVGNISSVARWLAVFPELEELEILGQAFTESGRSEEFCDAIVKACSHLKILRFNGDVIQDKTKPLPTIPLGED